MYYLLQHGVFFTSKVSHQSSNQRAVIISVVVVGIVLAVLAIAIPLTVLIIIMVLKDRRPIKNQESTYDAKLHSAYICMCYSSNFRICHEI